MSNDAARHDLAEVMALVQDQMANLATLQKKRAQLTATAAVADGTVTVEVDARGVPVRTEIDEAYFEDHDLADLGRHVTAAAQAAAQRVSVRATELLQPMIQRRNDFPRLSGMMDGIPDLRDLMPDLDRLLDTDTNADAETDPQFDDPDADDANALPTVRRS